MTVLVKFWLADVLSIEENVYCHYVDSFHRFIHLVPGVRPAMSRALDGAGGPGRGGGVRQSLHRPSGTWDSS